MSRLHIRSSESTSQSEKGGPGITGPPSGENLRGSATRRHSYLDLPQQSCRPCRNRMGICPLPVASNSPFFVKFLNLPRD